MGRYSDIFIYAYAWPILGFEFRYFEWHWCVAAGCVLGGRPGHDWRFCFPLWRTGGPGFGLCGGSNLETYLLMKWLGPDALAVCLLDFFCSGVKFCLLLGPCLCFVFLLYLDLCVLVDDALIGWGSFMQARCLCVLVHVWVGGGVGAVWPAWVLR